LKKPLTPENMKDGDDARNVYNPDKKPYPWHNYEKKNENPSTVLVSKTIYPAHPTGLEPPPRELTPT